MSLSEFMAALRRRWWVVLLCALLGLGSGWLAAKATKTTYTATTSVLVGLPGAGTVAELQQGDIFTMSRARSYAILASSRLVLDKVAVKVNAGPSDLSTQVSAAVQPETSVINISAVDGDPAYAAKLANATVAELATVVDEVDAGKAHGKQGGASVAIVQLSPAAQPTTPTTPATKMYMLFGLIAGLTVGLGAALVQRRPATLAPSTEEA